MQTYLMLGKYTTESLRDISAARTDNAVKAIQQLGGEILLMHALLGPYDIAALVHFPNNVDAVLGSVAVSRMTGISFTTLPAVPVPDFDREITRIP